MGTMRDFKNFVLPEKDCSEFCWRSERHLAFWDKLNLIGARNMKTQPPESVLDIDATVELSEQEWKQLEAEFLQL